jgi:hypothetical protein
MINREDAWCKLIKRRPDVARSSSRLTLLWNVTHHYILLSLVPNENKFWSKQVKVAFFD